MIIRIPRWANLTEDEKYKFREIMMEAKNASDLGFHDAANQLEEKANNYAFQQSQIKLDNLDEELQISP